MPKRLFTRLATDVAEERQVRTLAARRYAPGDGMRRARMLARSGDGRRSPTIAAAVGRHP